jgi:hypothetical protein
LIDEKEIQEKIRETQANWLVQAVAVKVKSKIPREKTWNG